jgi:hypothetical protein
MNLQRKSLLIGTLTGAVIGALGGYVFARGFQQARSGQDQDELAIHSVPPTEMVKLAIALVGVLRTVAELGERL